MKLQNSFRDYTAESALFVRRALVACTGILLLTGVLIANLYNLQIVEVGNQHAGQQQNSQKSDHRPAHKERGLCRIVAKRIL